jgi:hypothetical protein
MLAVFGFVNVIVSWLVPLAAIVPGLKLFTTVGAARTKLTTGLCVNVTAGGLEGSNAVAV